MSTHIVVTDGVDLLGHSPDRTDLVEGGYLVGVGGLRGTRVRADGREKGRKGGTRDETRSGLWRKSARRTESVATINGTMTLSLSLGHLPTLELVGVDLVGRGVRTILSLCSCRNVWGLGPWN